MKRPIAVACNGAMAPGRRTPLRLSHDPTDPERNVRIAVPEFVAAVYHLPDYVLDLIELAAFVYAGDRLSPRGPRDALEYHGWARAFKYYQRMRSPDRWSREAVAQLAKALEWVTGDRSYGFEFTPGYATAPESLFDTEEFALEPPAEGVAVLTFSGGLEAL